MKVCDHRLSQAATRLRDATRISREAEETMYLAEAELLRLHLLRYAQENPTFESFTWSTEWEYNDEGYDRCLYCFPQPEGIDDEYEFNDLVREFTIQALSLLCTGSAYYEKGSITLAELKSKRL